jgi:acyl dehydratase
MTVYLDRVGAESGETVRGWEPRDCALYALAVGAGFGERAFTVGESVYPTFVMSLTAAEAASWPDPAFATGDFDLHQVVLGQQSLVLHQPVESSGRVRLRTRVGAIVDKGSGALIELEILARDADSGAPAFTTTSGLFVVGEGGFGGLAASRGPVMPPPDRAPDHVMTYPTLPIQTLLYRYAGNDDNPVHLDPEFAVAAGFEGPILTGQNTLGFACRALVEATAAGDGRRLFAIEGRFRSPVYNGDSLTIEIWHGEDVGTTPDGDVLAVFAVSTQRGATVLDRGRASLRSSPDRAG